MKIPNIYIIDFKEGMNIKGFYLCKYVETKITRLGDEYLDFVLEDKTGIIRAKIWSFINNYTGLAENGKPVAVKGNIILYNNETLFGKCILSSFKSPHIITGSFKFVIFSLIKFFIARDARTRCL